MIFQGGGGLTCDFAGVFGERKCGGGLEADPTSQKRDVGHPLYWRFKSGPPAVPSFTAGFGLLTGAFGLLASDFLPAG